MKGCFEDKGGALVHQHLFEQTFLPITNLPCALQQFSQILWRIHVRSRDVSHTELDWNRPGAPCAARSRRSFKTKCCNRDACAVKLPCHGKRIRSDTALDVRLAERCAQ